jgi:hypothetical protein
VLVSTLCGVKSLSVWGRHLDQVADAVIEATKLLVRIDACVLSRFIRKAVKMVAVPVNSVPIAATKPATLSATLLMNGKSSCIYSFLMARQFVVLAHYSLGSSLVEPPLASA